MKLKEKNWSKDMEKPIYEEWKNSRRYKFIDTGKPVFSIDTPPPYVNTPVHIGQAVTYTLMDMFARFRRMTGHNVIFPLGLDRNGLPIEMAAEKRFGISMTDVSREEFTNLCRKVLEESSADTVDSFLRLGISFNSWNAGDEIGDIYMTDSKEYRTLTQDTFIDLWHKGLIYEDDRINNFCPGCKTTLADAEVDYEDKPTLFSDIIFTVKETEEKITIGTTRPELVCSCAMIIYHPDDKRYKHLKGKHAVTPIFNKIIPIMPHTFADPAKGTGLVMMCAFGDQTDIRFFREMKIEPVVSIGSDGLMNEKAGFLKGLYPKQARTKMLEELKSKNLVISQKQITHRTPICERSKHPIEFIAMREFYLRQIDFKDEMKKIAEQLNFFAPRSKQILLDWIESVSIDWPISRRRYYATEIPLWYCVSCKEVYVPEKGRYYQPWKESPPAKQCAKCGSSHFRGETRVLDTWFDSSNSPLYILHYGKNNDFFKNNTPCTLRPQGKEIVRTWLYYTLLKGYLLTKKRIFADAWINYHIVDEKGKKMSKSLGNTINPHEIIEKFGAEPFRLWCALEGNLEKDDMRCSSERIEGAGKTLTKLWNVTNFVSQFDWKHLNKDMHYFDAKAVSVELCELDKWIISDMNILINFAREQYEKYDFHNPAVGLRHFLWETFASHYLELVKNRAYNEKKKFSDAEQKSAVFTINYCLNNMLKLFYPVVPFITSKLYAEIYSTDIDKESFPSPIEIEEPKIKKEDLVELNSAIWKAKRDSGMSLKAEVKELTLPEVFASVEKDIVETHSVLHLKYGEHIEVKV